MEPKLPMPSPSPEMGGYRPETPQPIEAHPSPERDEQPTNGERNEVQQHMPPAEPAVVPTVPVIPVLTPSLQDDNTPVAQTLMDDNPLSASDEDLIEREWVDKAKRIVRETRTDPYRQEDEVSKLQADYIKKRYGKDIKLNK